MKIPNMLALFGLLSVVAAPLASAVERSNYIFRYNTSLSELMLDKMTFQKEEPLDLDGCTITVKQNGPLGCALNCEKQAVCLLAIVGPAGLGTSDILEKVDETPVTEDTSNTTSNNMLVPRYFHR